MEFGISPMLVLLYIISWRARHDLEASSGGTRSDVGTSAGFLMAPRHARWSGFSPSGTSALGSICRVHPRTKSRPIAVARLGPPPMSHHTPRACHRNRVVEPGHNS